MIKTKHYSILLLAFFLSVIFLAGCQISVTAPPPAAPAGLLDSGEIPPPPPLDPQRVAQGRELYAEFCADCHGPNGEGQPGWKTRNEDGSFKPPPHDNSGHTWHHDDELLLEIIADGSDFSQTQMPTFGDELSDEEIMAIIAYMKSWWGPEARAFQWQVTWQARQQK
jgi:mono/diheme cytochrome c family protein